MPHIRTLTMPHLAELLYADSLFSFKDHVVLALSIASLQSLPWQRSLQEVHQHIPVQYVAIGGNRKQGVCLHVATGRFAWTKLIGNLTTFVDSVCTVCVCAYSLPVLNSVGHVAS